MPPAVGVVGPVMRSVTVVRRSDTVVMAVKKDEIKPIPILPAVGRVQVRGRSCGSDGGLVVPRGLGLVPAFLGRIGPDGVALGAPVVALVELQGSEVDL